MRIGKFADMNNVSIDTIRHYMDLGLIVPEKRGGQYFFEERCQHDLELIFELKGMGFSLNETKMIFLYQTFAKFTDYEKDTYYQSLFIDKYEKIGQEIKTLIKMKENLRTKLDHLKTKSKSPSSVIGINLKALEMLKCIKCSENSLILQDGIINKNQIVDGKLICECGMDYTIESGILCVGKPYHSTTGLPFESDIPEYIHETDQAFLENIHKGAEWSKQKLAQLDLNGKVLLELGSGVGFFLRNIYQELPKDCLYIAVDRNLGRHRFLKSVLVNAGFKRNILFICADFLDIPLGDNSVDIVIDQTGTSNYSFEHVEFLLSELATLFKSKSYLLASFFAFKNFSARSNIEAKFRDNFMPNKIKENISRLKYFPIDERTSEYIDKGGKFENFFVQGEEIYSYSFFGKR